MVRAASIRALPVAEWPTEWRKVRVTAADSRRAGNCETGTNDWAARHLDGVSSATVGQILDALAASGDRTTLAIAACAVAIARKEATQTARKAA